MRFHVEMRAQDNAEASMEPMEARYADERQFGDQTLLQEARREVWRIRSIDTSGSEIGLNPFQASSAKAAVAA